MMTMRANFILVLLLLVAGCSWFEDKPDAPLVGDRKDVLQPADETAATSGTVPQLDAPSAVTAWPQENASAVQTGAHANFTPKFQEIWKNSMGDGQEDRRVETARPVGADGKIFAMDVRGHVSALDAATGKQLWRVSTRRANGGALAGGLAVEGGTLYVTNGLTGVLALSTQDGGLIWRTETDSPARAAPTVADGKVYALTRGDQTFALDAASGKILWQHHGLQEDAAVIAGAAPAVDSDMVVVPYASGEIMALSPGNGAVLWGDNLSVGRPQNNLATLHDSRAPPMLLSDMVIAANFAANAAAIERRLGDRIWGQSFGAAQPMTVSGDTVFMITTNAQLVALTRTGGEKFWSKPLPPPMKPDEDADPKQQYWFGPLVLNDQLLVISAEGTAQLRDAKTGEIASETKDLPPPAENPIVMNDTLYWVTADGNVVAYH